MSIRTGNVKEMILSFFYSILEKTENIPPLSYHFNIIRSPHLHTEAQIIHQQLFRSKAPDILCERYVAAHAALPELNPKNEQEFRTLNIIIQKNLDALGIEPWLRKKSIRHLLSCKILLIVYLSECDGNHLELRNEAIGRLKSNYLLTRGLFIGTVRLIRGWIQKVWYGLL